MLYCLICNKYIKKHKKPTYLIADYIKLIKFAAKINSY